MREQRVSGGKRIPVARFDALQREVLAHDERRGIALNVACGRHRAELSLTRASSLKAAAPTPTSRFRNGGSCKLARSTLARSEERRVGKVGRSRWASCCS